MKVTIIIIIIIMMDLCKLWFISRCREPGIFSPIGFPLFDIILSNFHIKTLGSHFFETAPTSPNVRVILRLNTRRISITRTGLC